jgi:hypothetical protein
VKDKEIWRDIPGYEGRYQASTMGHIRSVTRYIAGRSRNGTPFVRKCIGVTLQPGRYCKSGHVSVILGRRTSGKQVHRLIALTYLGDVPEGKEVLHNNGDPTDNRLCNLRYGTRTENILDVYRAGRRWRALNTDDVQEIRGYLLAGETGAAIARRMRISQSCVSAVKTGRTFKWLP